MGRNKKAKQSRKEAKTVPPTPNRQAILASVERSFVDLAVSSGKRISGKEKKTMAAIEKFRAVVKEEEGKEASTSAEDLAKRANGFLDQFQEPEKKRFFPEYWDDGIPGFDTMPEKDAKEVENIHRKLMAASSGGKIPVEEDDEKVDEEGTSAMVAVTAPSRDGRKAETVLELLQQKKEYKTTLVTMTEKVIVLQGEEPDADLMAMIAELDEYYGVKKEEDKTRDSKEEKDAKKETEKYDKTTQVFSFRKPMMWERYYMPWLEPKADGSPNPLLLLKKGFFGVPKALKK